MTALAISVLAMTVSGCAANRVDLVDSGVVTIEKQASGKVYIAWANAYEDEDGFVVTGVLRRHDTVGQPIRTTVDVEVVSPAGAVIDKGRSSDVYVSRRVIGRGGCFKRFKVHFQTIPPANSMVRVTVHSR